MLFVAQNITLHFRFKAVVFNMLPRPF